MSSSDEGGSTSCTSSMSAEGLPSNRLQRTVRYAARCRTGVSGGTAMFVRLWAFVFILASTIASAESIVYELYDVSSPSNRVLLAKGVKDYAPGDVNVDERLLDRTPNWSKEIPIAEGFNAGAVIYREKELTGFALQLKRRGGFMGVLSQGGFSWDWFDRESGLIFRKRQGGGRVKVSLVPSAEFQEIAAVEVLEDLTLRVIGKPWWFFAEDDTHHLVVRRGSVFRFAP